MRKRRPLLYDNDLRLIGVLDGAQAVGFRDNCADMSTASFSLGTLDPRNDDIVVQGSYIRLYDGEEDKGYYRIVEMPDEQDGEKGKVRYTCDSAQCTLLDNQMPGMHTIGDIGMRTRACIEYILGYQNPVRWVLDRCDFDDAFTYNFSSANLLDAMHAVGNAIVEPHEFVFDSTVVPWRVSLVRQETEPSCQLIKGRNALSIRRRISGSVITRLYAYGYGEGDNQLTIESVNGGKKYIDADTIDDWGIREGTHTDTRQTDPATLMANTQQLLEQAKEPQVGYVATAADIYRYTGERWDDVRAGALALVFDYRFKKPREARVLTREKKDVLGDNPSVTFELETALRSTADELNDLRDTVGIHELYAQGATTMYAQQFADNATPSKPAVMKFRIPTNVVRFNSILLSWDLERYRSPVAGAAAGGETVISSSAGGGATVTIPAQTVSTGVKYTSGPMSEDGSGAGLTGGPKDYLGNVSTSTDSAGNHSHNFTHVHALAGHAHAYSGTTTFSWNHTHYVSATGDYSSGVYNYANKSITIDDETDTSGTLWTTSGYAAVGGASMQATGTNGGHSHSFTHVHDMPHTHNMAHEHTIPPLIFQLETHRHAITVPEHEHESIYDIYEGPRAEKVTLIVDGETVPDDAIGEKDELDVIAYMRKNDEGKIVRGTWHTIEVVPDKNTRVVLNLCVQIFLQSRGAGDY